MKRADQLGERMIASVLGDLLQDDSLTRDAAKFERYLVTIVKTSYQFLLDHPSYLKIYAWEAAEEWKTWNQITYRPDDISPFLELAKKAQQNGLLRKDLDPTYFPIFIMQNVLMPVLTLRRYNSDGALDSEHASVQIASFLVRGLMDPSHLK